MRRITTLELCFHYKRIGAEGPWRLAGVLGQCATLAHLDLADLSYNQVGDAWAESLAEVLGQALRMSRADSPQSPQQ